MMSGGRGLGKSGIFEIYVGCLFVETDILFVITLTQVTIRIKDL